MKPIKHVQSAAILVFCLTALLFADKKTMYGQLFVGAQAGVNFSSLSDFPYVPPFAIPLPYVYMGIQSYYFAIKIEKSLSELLSVQTGLQVAERGLQYGKKPHFLIVYTTTYIDIPLLIKARWNIAQFSPYLLGGVSMGYHVGTHIESLAYGKYNIQNKIQPFDIGLVGGGGIMYHAAPTFSLFCESRYVFGLLNLGRNNNSPDVAREVQISLGIMCPLEFPEM